MTEEHQQKQLQKEEEEDSSDSDFEPGIFIFILVIALLLLLHQRESGSLTYNWKEDSYMILFILCNTNDDILLLLEMKGMVLEKVPSYPGFIMSSLHYEK